VDLLDPAAARPAIDGRGDQAEWARLGAMLGIEALGGWLLSGISSIAVTVSRQFSPLEKLWQIAPCAAGFCAQNRDQTLNSETASW
jgi:hypothetical protein